MGKAGTVTPDAALGARLAQLRRDRSLTQVELAAKLGIDQPLLSSYETGRLRLHAGMIVRLSQALRVSADEILGLVPDRDSRAAGTTRVRRLHRNLDRLSPHQQRTVAQVVDGLLARRASRA